jgi:hypothetical protein
MDMNVLYKCMKKIQKIYIKSGSCYQTFNFAMSRRLIKLLGQSDSTLKFFVIFPSSGGLELSLGMTTTLLLYFLTVPRYAAIHRTTAGYKKMLSI